MASWKGVTPWGRATGDTGLLGGQELHRHAATEPGVAREEDAAHAAAAELADHLVLPDLRTCGEHLLGQFGPTGRRASMESADSQP
jgi:hypothetical protein